MLAHAFLVPTYFYLLPYLRYRFWKGKKIHKKCYFKIFSDVGFQRSLPLFGLHFDDRQRVLSTRRSVVHGTALLSSLSLQSTCSSTCGSLLYTRRTSSTGTFVRDWNLALARRRVAFSRHNVSIHSVSVILFLFLRFDWRFRSLILPLLFERKYLESLDGVH